MKVNKEKTIMHDMNKLREMLHSELDGDDKDRILYLSRELDKEIVKYYAVELTNGSIVSLDNHINDKKDEERR